MKALLAEGVGFAVSRRELIFGSMVLSDRVGGGWRVVPHRRRSWLAVFVLFFCHGESGSGASLDARDGALRGAV